MSSQEITVRSADTSDRDRLLALCMNCAGAPQWTAGTWQQVLESAATGRQRLVLAAESAGALAGFGVLGLSGEGAEIESLAVSVAWRRRGVGRRLCEELLIWARKQGAVEASLEVRVSNLPARSLYGLLGFREAGVRRGYYREPDEDALVMTTEL